MNNKKHTIKLPRATLDILKSSAEKGVSVPVGLITDTPMLAILKNDTPLAKYTSSSGFNITQSDIEYVGIEGYSLNKKNLEEGAFTQGTSLVVGTEKGDYVFPGIWLMLQISTEQRPRIDPIVMPNAKLFDIE